MKRLRRWLRQNPEVATPIVSAAAVIGFLGFAALILGSFFQIISAITGR